MTIERLGPIDPIQKLNHTEKATKPAPAKGTDSISFSDEAKLKAELYKATEAVKSTPDVRADRVAEIKQKMEDPNYINERIDAVADQVMEMFGL